MLPGDVNSQTVLQGLLLLHENEEESKQLKAHVGIRQHLAYSIGRVFPLLYADRSEIKQRLVALSNANLALEARVLELEQRLARLMVTLQ
jgi:hypothetical protein